MRNRRGSSARGVGVMLVGILVLSLQCDEGVDPSEGALERLLHRSDAPAFPAALDSRFDEYVEACRQRDAARLWAVFSPRLREELDALARETVHTVPETRWRRAFRFEEHQAGFDGTAYLQGLVGDLTAKANPCKDFDLWRRVQVGPDGDDWIFVVEHPRGGRQAFRFVDVDGHWRLDDLSLIRPPDHTPSREAEQS